MRSSKDIGRVCTMCEQEIYIDKAGDIECACGEEQEENE